MGKGCHANDEREVLMDLGARAQRMQFGKRAGGGANGFFSFFTVSFFPFSHLKLLSELDQEILRIS